ncbi:MAG: RnfABCDGE type electron transport complex subunit G [Candidatus Aminicenantes bacterium]|nr:RnfABCDGE type electron transport complex subunit G [Candidatus Aminicenantes bacterium]
MSSKKKLPSTFFNMVLVLTTVAVLSALALSFTYSGTKEARAMVEVKRTLKALQEVLPAFDNDPDSEKYNLESDADLLLYPAKKEGQPAGTAVKTYSDKGFTERIWLMVGFDKDNKIYKTWVLKQRETPGLGTKMKEPKFRNQFSGKDPAAFNLKVKKDGGQVDAITAATISSRAFCDAVDRAYRALLGGGKK